MNYKVKVLYWENNNIVGETKCGERILIEYPSVDKENIVKIGLLEYNTPQLSGKVSSVLFFKQYIENNIKKVITKTNEKMNKVKEVLQGVYDNPDLRKSIVPLFIGNPGLGKSVMIKEFAKERGVKIVELITSQMNPFEISGIGMPDKDSKKMSIWDFDTLLGLEDGDIIFFDELLNGNPVVLNACLTLIESRKMISGKSLPNIMIVAAANPQGMVPITPQIKERFVWYNVNFNPSMWEKVMTDKYDITETIGISLCRLIQSEDFQGSNNFSSARSIDKAVNMIINEVPTPYEDKVKPLLDIQVKNPFNGLVILPDGTHMEPGDKMSWLDLAKLKRKK